MSARHRRAETELAVNQGDETAEEMADQLKFDTVGTEMDTIEGAWWHRAQPRPLRQAVNRMDYNRTMVNGSYLTMFTEEYGRSGIPTGAVKSTRVFVQLKPDYTKLFWMEVEDGPDTAGRPRNVLLPDTAGSEWVHHMESVWWSSATPMLTRARQVAKCDKYHLAFSVQTRNGKMLDFQCDNDRDLLCWFLGMQFLIARAFDKKWSRPALQWAKSRKKMLQQSMAAHQSFGQMWRTTAVMLAMAEEDPNELKEQFRTTPGLMQEYDRQVTGQKNAERWGCMEAAGQSSLWLYETGIETPRSLFTAQLTQNHAALRLSRDGIVITSIDLTRIIKIVYGPYTSTFKTASIPITEPWLCLSLVTAYGTAYDLQVCDEDDLVTWFLGLQAIVVPPGSFMYGKSQMILRKAKMKINQTAKERAAPIETLFYEAVLRSLNERSEFESKSGKDRRDAVNLSVQLEKRIKANPEMAKGLTKLRAVQDKEKHVVLMRRGHMVEVFDCKVYGSPTKPVMIKLTHGDTQISWFEKGAVFHKGLENEALQGQVGEGDSSPTALVVVPPPAAVSSSSSSASALVQAGHLKKAPQGGGGTGSVPASGGALVPSAAAPSQFALQPFDHEGFRDRASRTPRQPASPAPAPTCTVERPNAGDPSNPVPADGGDVYVRFEGQRINVEWLPGRVSKSYGCGVDGPLLTFRTVDSYGSGTGLGGGEGVKGGAVTLSDGSSFLNVMDHDGKHPDSWVTKLASIRLNEILGVEYTGTELIESHKLKAALAVLKAANRNVDNLKAVLAETGSGRRNLAEAIQKVGSAGKEVKALSRVVDAIRTKSAASTFTRWPRRLENPWHCITVRLNSYTLDFCTGDSWDAFKTWYMGLQAMLRHVREKGYAAGLTSYTAQDLLFATSNLKVRDQTMRRRMTRVRVFHDAVMCALFRTNDLSKRQRLLQHWDREVVSEEVEYTFKEGEDVIMQLPSADAIVRAKFGSRDVTDDIQYLIDPDTATLIVTASVGGMQAALPGRDGKVGPPAAFTCWVSKRMDVPVLSRAARLAGMSVDAGRSFRSCREGSRATVYRSRASGAALNGAVEDVSGNGCHQQGEVECLASAASYASKGAGGGGAKGGGGGGKGRQAPEWYAEGVAPGGGYDCLGTAPVMGNLGSQVYTGQVYDRVFLSDAHTFICWGHGGANTRLELAGAIGVLYGPRSPQLRRLGYAHHPGRPTWLEGDNPANCVTVVFEDKVYFNLCLPNRAQATAWFMALQFICCQLPAAAMTTGSMLWASVKYSIRHKTQCGQSNALLLLKSAMQRQRRKDGAWTKVKDKLDAIQDSHHFTITRKQALLEVMLDIIVDIAGPAAFVPYPRLMSAYNRIMMERDARRRWPVLQAAGVTNFKMLCKGKHKHVSGSKAEAPLQGEGGDGEAQDSSRQQEEGVRKVDQQILSLELDINGGEDDQGVLTLRSLDLVNSKNPAGELSVPLHMVRGIALGYDGDRVSKQFLELAEYERAMLGRKKGQGGGGSGYVPVDHALCFTIMVVVPRTGKTRSFNVIAPDDRVFVDWFLGLQALVLREENEPKRLGELVWMRSKARLAAKAAAAGGSKQAVMLEAVLRSLADDPDKVKELIENPRMRARLREHRSASAEHYHTERMYAATEELTDTYPGVGPLYKYSYLDEEESEYNNNNPIHREEGYLRIVDLAYEDQAKIVFTAADGLTADQMREVHEQESLQKASVTVPPAGAKAKKKAAAASSPAYERGAPGAGGSLREYEYHLNGVVGITYGIRALTLSVAQELELLEENPWMCFSILCAPDRSDDTAPPDSQRGGFDDGGDFGTGRSSEADASPAPSAPGPAFHFGCADGDVLKSAMLPLWELTRRQHPIFTADHVGMNEPLFVEAAFTLDDVGLPGIIKHVNGTSGELVRAHPTDGSDVMYKVVWGTRPSKAAMEDESKLTVTDVECVARMDIKYFRDDGDEDQADDDRVVVEKTLKFGKPGFPVSRAMVRLSDGSWFENPATGKKNAPRVRYMGRTYQVEWGSAKFAAQLALMPPEYDIAGNVRKPPAPPVSRPDEFYSLYESKRPKTHPGLVSVKACESAVGGDVLLSDGTVFQNPSEVYPHRLTHGKHMWQRLRMKMQCSAGSRSLSFGQLFLEGVLKAAVRGGTVFTAKQNSVVHFRVIEGGMKRQVSSFPDGPWLTVGKERGARRPRLDGIFHVAFTHGDMVYVDTNEWPASPGASPGNSPALNAAPGSVDDLPPLDDDDDGGGQLVLGAPGGGGGGSSLHERRGLDQSTLTLDVPDTPEHLNKGQPGGSPTSLTAAGSASPKSPTLVKGSASPYWQFLNPLGGLEQFTKEHPEHRQALEELRNNELEADWHSLMREGTDVLRLQRVAKRKKNAKETVEVDFTSRYFMVMNTAGSKLYLFEDEAQASILSRHQYSSLERSPSGELGVLLPSDLGVDCEVPVVDLSLALGVRFGKHSKAFKASSSYMARKEWRCMSLVMPQETYNFVAMDDVLAAAWFLGLQPLVQPVGQARINYGKLLWMRVRMKCEMVAISTGTTVGAVIAGAILEAILNGNLMERGQDASSVSDRPLQERLNKSMNLQLHDMQERRYVEECVGLMGLSETLLQVYTPGRGGDGQNGGMQVWAFIYLENEALVQYVPAAGNTSGGGFGSHLDGLDDLDGAQFLPIADIRHLTMGIQSDVFADAHAEGLLEADAWNCFTIACENAETGFEYTIDVATDDAEALMTWYLGLQSLMPIMSAAQRSTGLTAFAEGQSKVKTRGGLLWTKVHLRLDHMCELSGKSRGSAVLDTMLLTLHSAGRLNNILPVNGGDAEMHARTCNLISNKQAEGFLLYMQRQRCHVMLAMDGADPLAQLYTTQLATQRIMDTTGRGSTTFEAKKARQAASATANGHTLLVPHVLQLVVGSELKASTKKYASGSCTSSPDGLDEAGLYVQLSVLTTPYADGISKTMLEKNTHAIDINTITHVLNGAETEMMGNLPRREQLDLRTWQCMSLFFKNGQREEEQRVKTHFNSLADVTAGRVQKKGITRWDAPPPQPAADGAVSVGDDIDVAEESTDHLNKFGGCVLVGEWRKRTDAFEAYPEEEQIMYLSGGDGGGMALGDGSDEPLPLAMRHFIYVPGFGVFSNACPLDDDTGSWPTETVVADVMDDVACYCEKEEVVQNWVLGLNHLLYPDAGHTQGAYLWHRFQNRMDCEAQRSGVTRGEYLVKKVITFALHFMSEVYRDNMDDVGVHGSPSAKAASARVEMIDYRNRLDQLNTRFRWERTREKLLAGVRLYYFHPKSLSRYEAVGRLKLVSDGGTGRVNSGQEDTFEIAERGAGGAVMVTVKLSEVRGLFYGPKARVFETLRLTNALTDPPWLCFSIHVLSENNPFDKRRESRVDAGSGPRSGSTRGQKRSTFRICLSAPDTDIIETTVMGLQYAQLNNHDSLIENAFAVNHKNNAVERAHGTGTENVSNMVPISAGLLVWRRVVLRLDHEAVSLREVDRVLNGGGLSTSVDNQYRHRVVTNAILRTAFSKWGPTPYTGKARSSQWQMRLEIHIKQMLTGVRAKEFRLGQPPRDIQLQLSVDGLKIGWRDMETAMNDNTAEVMDIHGIVFGPQCRAFDPSPEKDGGNGPINGFDRERFCTWSTFSVLDHRGAYLNLCIPDDDKCMAWVMGLNNLLARLNGDTSLGSTWGSYLWMRSRTKCKDAADGDGLPLSEYLVRGIIKAAEARGVQNARRLFKARLVKVRKLRELRKVDARALAGFVGEDETAREEEEEEYFPTAEELLQQRMQSQFKGNLEESKRKALEQEKKATAEATAEATEKVDRERAKALRRKEQKDRAEAAEDAERNMARPKMPGREVEKGVLYSKIKAVNTLCQKQAFRRQLGKARDGSATLPKIIKGFETHIDQLEKQTDRESLRKHVDMLRRYEDELQMIIDDESIPLD